MSLNGDVTVMRNGRSTSTVSIYNYPEHLNPFYEDDQHRRLRFWPINKKDDEGRRNSFSLGGFKDMWAFKSFRTKKKSSTLGINKTSESPPTLRRVYPIDSNNLFNSYDRRARYSSNDGDNFQRNAPYRSSLQNVQSTQGDSNGFGLNRNDQYRSTIQFGNRTQSTKQTLPVPQPRRYVYGGSVTPQPSRNEFGRGYSREGLTHGSSQTSISTNPFDSDNDEENASLGGKRTPRKKRRAPAPPTPIDSQNGASYSPDESSQTNRTQPELRIEENLDIANLTAEIESFVKTKNNDKTTPEKELQVTESKETTVTNKELPKTNGTIPKTKPILKSSSNQVITKHFRPKPQNTELQIHEDLKIEERPALPAKKRAQSKPATQQNNQQIGSVECIHIHVTGPQPTTEEDTTNRVTTFKKEPIPIEKITAKTSFTLASPPGTRREVSKNSVTMQKTKVVETVTTVKTEKEEKFPPSSAHHIVNGIEKNEGQRIKESQMNASAAVVKPPIASKPVMETNSNANNFVAKTKPETHVILNGEPKNSLITTQTIVKPKEIDAEKVQTSMETSETATTQIVNVNGSQSNKFSVNGTDKEKQKLEEQVTPVPKIRASIEKAEISSKSDNGKLTVFVKSDGEKAHETHVAPPVIDSEAGAQSLLKTNASPKLEIVETQENSLHIDEPTTSASVIRPPVPNTRINSKPRTAILSESREEFEALYRNRPSSHTEWKQSTLAPLEPHIPPEKRRSVKDIIESINRSQRLLHAAAQKDLPELITTRGLPPPSYSEVVDEKNYKPNRNTISTTDNDLSQTLKTLDEAQREIDSMFPSTSAAINGATGSSHNGSPNPDTHKLNNEEIFKKDRVNKEVYDYRETSPTASNLDWNPVPKPKRSKNLNDQREH